jgi:hypothetical protein
MHATLKLCRKVEHSNPPISTYKINIQFMINRQTHLDPLSAHHLIVGGVALTGQRADIHHLPPHGVLHIRVAHHGVAVQHLRQQ